MTSAPAQTGPVAGGSAPGLAVPGLAGAISRRAPSAEAGPQQRNVVGVLQRTARPAARSAALGESDSRGQHLAAQRMDVLRRTSARSAGHDGLTTFVTPPVIRRAPTELKSKNVMAGMRTIPIVAQQLGLQLAQGPTALEHVERALKKFDKHLATKTKGNAFINEAIRIATVIDATAAELAKSINDPTLKPQIAKELIAAYRPELKLQLGSVKKNDRDKQTDKALDLAETIVSDDPVTLYMTDKVKLADAAWRVRDMAASAKTVDALQMLHILRNRFEMELGSHSQDEVSAGVLAKDQITETDDKGTETVGPAGFDLADLIGEISSDFYLRAVPLPKTPKDRGKLPKWGSKGLAMKGVATQKLDALEKAVIDTNLKATTLTTEALTAERNKSGTDLNKKQSEHFARLRTEEAGDADNYEGKGESPRSYVVTKFVARYGLSQPKAESLIDDVLKAFETVPLTLTSKLENLFKERPDKLAEPQHGSAYKSEPALMQQAVDVSTLVGKPDRGTKTMSIGRPDDDFKKGRGENYLRWRRDKDERETGYHGLEADDLPVFAAVNPNFTTTKGGNANLAEWDNDQGKWTGTTYGANYYGDMHLLLKDSVRKRSTLIARGKKDVLGRRIERTDLTFLLADMFRMGMIDYVDAMVAGLKKPDVVVLTNMDAEVHVYGGLDMAKDVAAFYLSPVAFAATDGAADRCKKFAKGHGITVHDIGSMPADYDITAKQGVKGGIDLKDLLKGT
ncbi:MAG: hypothetical protein ABI345_10380 [Jatrophihabitans sp.]